MKLWQNNFELSKTVLYRNLVISVKIFMTESDNYKH